MADTSVGQVFAVKRCSKLAFPPYYIQMYQALLYQDVPNLLFNSTKMSQTFFTIGKLPTYSTKMSQTCCTDMSQALFTMLYQDLPNLVKLTIPYTLLTKCTQISRICCDIAYHTMFKTLQLYCALQSYKTFQLLFFTIIILFFTIILLCLPRRVPKLVKLHSLTCVT